MSANYGASFTSFKLWFMFCFRNLRCMQHHITLDHVIPAPDYTCWKYEIHRPAENISHFNNCVALWWRHNGRDGVSNHQPHDCLLNCLFRRRSNKTSKLRVTGLCVGNSQGTGEFLAQMASNAENVSISWRHHDMKAHDVNNNSTIQSFKMLFYLFISHHTIHATLMDIFWWPFIQFKYAILHCIWEYLPEMQSTS